MGGPFALSFLCVFPLLPASNTSYYDINVNEKPKQDQDELLKVQALAQFRAALRRFMAFSERKAAEAGLQPQQHQLMLQIAGAPDGVDTTISYIAEQLGLRHNSVVELSKRCADAGYVERIQTESDHRFVVLKLTASGSRALRSLSKAHAHELLELGPELISALAQVEQLTQGEEKKA